MVPRGRPRRGRAGAGVILRSIRARILAVFALSLLAFAGALVYGLVQLRSIGDGLRTINAVYLPMSGVVADLSAVLRQMDRDLERGRREGPRPLAGHRSNAAFYSASLADDIARGRSMVSAAGELVQDPDEQRALEGAMALLGQIDTSRRSFDDAASAWLEGTAEQGEATAARVQLDMRKKELGLQIDQLAALVEGRILAVSERTAQAQVRALTVSGTLSGLAALLAGVLAGFALLTLQPIGRLTAQVQRLAAGEASPRVDVRSRDEVGVLAREFNSMAEAVAERDRRLSERADALDRLSLRLRGVLDAIRAGLIVVEGSPGRVTMANPAATRLWAVSEGGAPPEPLAALLPSGSAGRRAEALPIAGRLFDVDLVPFGPSGTLIVGEDVTQRDQDRKRLARSERLALVGQMLAQITHEVRNPLNAMSLNVELLSDEVQAGTGEPSEALAMLDTITGEIHRLERITARYLDLSRRREPELVPADPLGLAREIVRVEEEVLRRAGVEVQVEGAELGLVELDGDALRRALRNVLRNAVEAGAHNIWIRVERAGDRAQITVRDDGSGMDAAQVDRAFEPFYTTKAQGTGLGLAISRQELEDGGGSLRAEAQPGAGCTFTLSMPALPVAREAAVQGS